MRGRRATHRARPEDRGPLRTAHAGELSQRYLGADDRATAGVQLADAVLTDTADPAVTALKARLRRAVARAESSDWRADPAGADVALRVLRKDLDALAGKVVLRGGQVLLTSASGTVQVSVEEQPRRGDQGRRPLQGGTTGLQAPTPR